MVSCYKLPEVFIHIYRIICIVLHFMLYIIIELPVLSRDSTHFLIIYPETVIQHDDGKQVDIFLACSLPIESPSPVMEQDSSISFLDDMSVLRSVYHE